MKRLIGFGILTLLVVLSACSSNNPHIKIKSAHAKIEKSNSDPVSLRYDFKVENTHSLKTMDWKSVKLKIKPSKKLRRLSDRKLGHDIFASMSSWGNGFLCKKNSNKYCHYHLSRFLDTKHGKKLTTEDIKEFKQKALHAELIVKKKDKTETIDLNSIDH